MFKTTAQINMRHNLLILGLILSAIPLVYAQSWDIHNFPQASGNDVEILLVDLAHNVLTLKFYPNEQVDQFKVVSCYVDNAAVIEWDKETVGIETLKPGMKMSSDGAIYKQSVRSCENLKVLNLKDEKTP